MKSGYCFLSLMLLLLASCVKPYEPAVITGVNNFLVVDGIINMGANAVTTVALSRTRSLGDTVIFHPELHSQVAIEAENGTRYFLQEGDSGLYKSVPLNVNASDRYRLNITTADGRNYLSDYVAVKATPPLDSVTWRQTGDTVSILISTHDPQNSTRYYRWTYEEDWENDAFYDSNLEFRNGKIVFRDSSAQIFRCWKHDASTNILLHSTAQLSQDLVVQETLLQLPAASPKIEKWYSVLARQFALTEEAYNYWQVLQKNTEQLGGLFGVQPSLLIGNIHNSENPDEPVIGFMSAATEQTSRILIRRSSIVNGYTNSGAGCPATNIPTAEAVAFLSSGEKLPAYFVGMGGFTVAIADARCVDCRVNGGTAVKPPFMP
jgi:hypothetical protein